MRATKLTKRVHPIGTQRKPNVLRLIAKLWVGIIEILPLLAIGWVPQHAITLLVVS
jgi:hypothetical protein